MRTRVPRIVSVCLLVGVLVTAPGGAGAATAGPGYLTISFGRTQWVSAANCAPIANAVPLDRVAADMASRGMTGTGNVITDRTRETGFLCVGYYMLEPGWDRLAMLRDTYGWSFVSASKSYADITTLSPSQQRAESCDTLATFEAHGVEPEQPSLDVDQRPARRAARQRRRVLDGAGDAAPARPAKAAALGGHEAKRGAQPAPARVGERDDRRPDCRRVAGLPGDGGRVAGVDRQDGEVELVVGGGPLARLAAPVGEQDAHLLAARVVGVGQHAALADHDAGAKPPAAS